MDNPATDTPPLLKRNSNDVGWEYGLLCDPQVPDKVRCRLCGKEFSGGVYIMKEHIGHLKGNVSACPRSSKEIKRSKRKHEEAIRGEVNIKKNSNVEELEKKLGTLKAPHFQGPLDQFATVINPEASLASQTRQQNIHDAISKEKTHIYQLKEPLLNEEKQRTKEKLKALEEEWDREGCSVMTDSWTDMKRRSIMNLCVNSRGGTCFLLSKDASKDSYTDEYIFNYTDKEEAKSLTGCAAHSMDLMLEGISKLPGFANVIEQAKVVTIFVYAHHTTLSMMRTYTKKKDIVRLGATSVMVILKVFTPMVKVLRLADGEKIPSLGFVYGGLLEAKKSIKEATGHLEKNYQPIFRIIDEKMKRRLDSPLHMAAYFFSPYNFYKDPTIQYDIEILEGFIKCVKTFYHGEFEKQDLVVNHEISLYKNKSGPFGRMLALKECEKNDEKFDPDHIPVGHSEFNNPQVRT
uniref:DUF659 domain-containing protein n=1 Tax=Brassica oleracea var. oleracea TaxID=109376 RepID=A0A0D3B9M5_BRAOL